MDKKFSYNPETPYRVLRNGQEIGALVAGFFYRFDSDRHCTETFAVVDDVLFEYGKQVGRFEGSKIIMEKSNDILEVIEP